MKSGAGGEVGGGSVQLNRGAVQLTTGAEELSGGGHVQSKRGGAEEFIGVGHVQLNIGGAEELVGLGHVQLKRGGAGGGEVQLKRGADQLKTGADQLKTGAIGGEEGDRTGTRSTGQHVQWKRGGSVAFEGQVIVGELPLGVVKFQLNIGVEVVGAEPFAERKLGFNFGQHVQLKRGAA